MKGLPNVKSKRGRAIIFCNQGDWRVEKLTSGLLECGFKVHTLDLQLLFPTLKNSTICYAFI
jgi:hypothetical protein